MQKPNPPPDHFQNPQETLLHLMEGAHKILHNSDIAASKDQNIKLQSDIIPSDLFTQEPPEVAPSKAHRWKSVFEPSIPMAHRLRRVPFLGYGLAVLNSFINLPKFLARLKTLEKFYEKQVQKDLFLKHFLNETESRLRSIENLSVGKRLMDIDKLMLHKQITSLKKDLLAIQITTNAITSQQGQLRSTSNDNTENSAVKDLSLGLSYQDFYVDFENEFRGSKEDIKSRLEVYLPFVMQSPRNSEGKLRDIIDIGCGRGEWLELLYEHNMNGLGIDLNRSMVEHCSRLGFNAVCDDAIEYLKRLPKNSAGVITGFHIIEHIPFEKLLELFDAALHALCDGGIVIFETPNPENLRVGAYSFYKDPTHINPLVPCVVHFMAKQRGFAHADLLRLHPFPDDSTIKEDSHIAEILNKELFGPQDYALIARK